MRIIISMIIPAIVIIAVRFISPDITTHPYWDLLNTALFIVAMLAIYYFLGYLQKTVPWADGG